MAKRKLNLDDAKDQAAEYWGFASSEVIEIEGEEFEIPFPQLLSAEQQQAMREMNVRFEDCDREPDTKTPDVKLSDGSVILGEVGPGPYKEPRRLKGELMDPPRDVQICIALWGEDKARRFIAKGGPPGIVDMIWGRMNDEYQKRAKQDPK